MTWDDLSDDELPARLEQRGVGRDQAVVLVWHREDYPERATIEELLAG